MIYPYFGMDLKPIEMSISCFCVSNPIFGPNPISTPSGTIAKFWQRQVENHIRFYHIPSYWHQNVWLTSDWKLLQGATTFFPEHNANGKLTRCNPKERPWMGPQFIVPFTPRRNRQKKTSKSSKSSQSPVITLSKAKIQKAIKTMKKRPNLSELVVLDLSAVGWWEWYGVFLSIRFWIHMESFKNRMFLFQSCLHAGLGWRGNVFETTNQLESIGLKWTLPMVTIYMSINDNTITWYNSGCLNNAWTCWYNFKPAKNQN